MLRAAWLGTYVQTQHDDHEVTVQQGEIDLVHDQDLIVTETRLALDVGITRRFGASVVVPVRVVSTSIRYLAKAGGEEVDLAMPGIHHRNETLSGIADPMLLGAYTTALGPTRVVVRGGLTLPLGRTEDNPFTAEAETMPHEHVQMGAGTFRPVLSVDVSYPWRTWRFGGYLFTQQSFYENSRGFETGDRYAGGLSVGRALGKRWSLRGGAEVQGETAEAWDGDTVEDDGNRGRIDAMFTAGATYQATDRLAIDATIKVPFVTHAVGGQLDMPAILEVGAAWRFGALPKAKPADDHDHEHEHGDHAHGDEHGDEHGDDADGDAHGDEHGDEHAHGDEHGDHDQVDQPGTVVDKPGVDQPGTVAKPGTVVDKPGVDKPGTVVDKPGVDKPTPPKPVAKPDVAELNKPGEAPDLVPVKGKLTIFDFWATWCKPCKTLDPALVELARKYPSIVAIRKLDVVDWDSKAAERYLTPGAFDLPHLKIYDASGKRILEKSSAVGKLQDLIDEVRGLVEAEAKRRGVQVAPKSAVPAQTHVAIEANAGGFSPARIAVPRGVPVTLSFTRTAEKSCATEVIFDVDGKRITKALPLGQRVDITVTFPKPGTIPFTCQMDMYRGTIDVR